VLVALEELEDLLHDNVLDVDLVLVVQVGSGELDLKRVSGMDFFRKIAVEVEGWAGGGNRLFPMWW
jgi:hypothetical protein